LDAQLLEVAAHIAALLLEVERAQTRNLFRAKPGGTAPRRSLVRAGQSRRCGNESSASRPSIFTVLIEGASGPQPHPNFIDFFG
jgi:hypothetical protein